MLKKTSIFLFVLLFFSLSTNAQYIQKNVSKAIRHNVFTQVLPPSIFRDRTFLAKTSTSTFIVVASPNYELPIDARTAIEYAASILSYVIKTDQQIKIFVEWKDLEDTTTLAESNATSFKEIYNSDLDQTFQYPIALAEAMASSNLNDDNNEIHISFNCNTHFDWYCGTDGIPQEDKYDLVSVAMHEIMHGLGFAGSMTVENGVGSYGFNTTNNYPTPFDYYAIIGDYYQTNTNRLLSYGQNSVTLAQKLTSDDVYYDGYYTHLVNDMKCAKLYAPAEWADGSSFSHLDEETYPVGCSNSLMLPGRNEAEVVQSPGEVGLSMLQDLGWEVNNIITITNPTGESAWKKGQLYNINFTTNLGGTFIINLYNSNGLFNRQIGTATVNPGARSFAWTIPTDVVNGQYKIKFENFGEGWGVSSVFTISQEEQVATPVISPKSGTYSTRLPIRITCATDGAQIYYTTNGNEPTITNGTLYEKPFKIDPPKTIIAKAFKENWIESVAAHEVYSFNGIYIYVLNKTGHSFGTFDYWEDNKWNIHESSESIKRDVPFYLRVDQALQINTNEKFHRWYSVDEVKMYFNWVKYTSYAPTLEQLFSEFKESHLVTIQNAVEGFLVVNSDSIGFKDPWLTDSTELPFEKKNKYMLAPYKTRKSPFSPDYTTSYNGDIYKGVFLEQGGPISNLTPPYYSINTKATKTINGRVCYFKEWSANTIDGSPSALFNNASLSQTDVVFEKNGAVVSALMKGTSLSNSTSAYSSNSQRKVIKTADNVLHSVYQSMGKVWYEKSTDNGTTWLIMNNVQPLSSSNAKNPSIAAVGNGSNVLIAFQEESGTNYNIKIISVNYLVNQIQDTKFVSVDRPYTDESHPVAYYASYQSNRNLLLCWEQKYDGLWNPGGIYYLIGNMTGLAGQEINLDPSNALHIANTDNSYCNPTLMGSSEHPDAFHIAYQQDPAANSSKIWYDTVAVVNNLLTFPRDRIELSAGSGYSLNYNPSIIEINGGARVVWVGSRQMDSPDKATTVTGTGVNVLYKPTTITINTVVFKSPRYSRFWYFGSNVQGPTITKSANNLYYSIAWNETTTNYNKYADNTLSTIRNFNMPGNSVQVCNGAAKADMLGIVFDARTPPYTFNKTNTLNVLGKETATGLSINYGRQGLVKKDDLQFYFALGDIIANEQSVGFTNVPEEFAVTSIETLNGMLISEPFTINDGGSFIYSVQYGLVGNIVQEFPTDKYINFKVKMIDANTGELLRLFDNVTYSTENLQQYNNLVYQVNVSGIGNKTVKLCLEVGDNLEAEYFAADKLTDENILAKANIQQVELNETVVIKDYDLFQNYPNPFNPSTTISFQMPKDGFVTLKIYDILGKEVTTLVNEFKTTGKYNVQFNASNLASGMYIYQIKAGDYSNTKKLMLMK